MTGTTTFQELLTKYRKISFSERDKGDRFERLMQAYLRTDPTYAYKFKKVWLWNEFPGKLDLGGGDTGIDLVALTHEGDYWAIQCKCYQEKAVIDKPSVDSFLSTSSGEFKNEEYKTTRFVYRLWISTTNHWGPNATEAIKNQYPPVTRVNLFDLVEAPVDWEKLDNGIHGEASRSPKKTLRPHQKDSLDKTHEYFKNAERGKLIMACGTGKTFNSLRIAENETNGKGLILFMVPSIALLGQTLREWSADATEPINAVCICSDPEISRKKTRNDEMDNFSVVDLALPASTDPEKILHQFRQIREKGVPGMTVVFSTYQSIDVIARAQKVLLKNGFPEFDLIVCDEAHRTTGVTLADEDESAFTKVHDNEYIRGKKRLYMTATPRLYNDDAKSRAAQSDAVLCSMDDAALYGKEIYRIGFGEAVRNDLLTDYKVMILTLNVADVPPAVQKMITNENSEITIDDASRLIGCVNALSKQLMGDDGTVKEADPLPMRRAVAFCGSIKDSKKITDTYNTATDTYLGSLPLERKEQMVSVASRHIDGTMSAPQRDELLGWLKAESDDNECRILTNVRCLSEGVDVPSLDAVLFLSARNSQVDVVQSVGRVMRKAPGKKYGYIIIPVVVPYDMDADKALDSNETYRVVWSVLNALRAHDDRFNATVNKIELNNKRPDQIVVGRIGAYSDEEEYHSNSASGANLVAEQNRLGRQIAIQFEQLQSVVYARMVQKVGQRRYWEQWAKDVALIAAQQIGFIEFQIKQKPAQRAAFDQFLESLRHNINPSIDEEQAKEMLSQHIITQPVFEALFEGGAFVKNNPVSKAMQEMIDALEGDTAADGSENLQKFYESVRMRAEGIDNPVAKQKIIIELYDQFFKTAFPKMVEQLGIAYTPIPVVDFIIHSVNDVLKKEFGRSLTDKGVHILEPFAGTGTFITRLLDSNLIAAKDLQRKYKYELHANEIVLLAYYIAAINIENTYHSLTEENEYRPFEGMVLTDTFQIGEDEAGGSLFPEMFPQNSERLARQKKAPFQVIMGNPPYSVGQKSANDNAQNQKYDKLDARIAATYAKATDATNKNALYDSYLRAFRWSTDRLDPEQGGIIAFVSNGSWLDGNSTAGFRKVIEREFTSIWVFNLRGNQRTSGELSRKEGGKIFGSGSRASISVTILAKNPAIRQEKATIRYYDIGDYLSREEKLARIDNFKTVESPGMEWKTLQPNEHGDWISQRNESFDEFIPIGDKDDKQNKATFFVPFYSNGLKTQRDAWCYNSSKISLRKNIQRTFEFYDSQRIAISKGELIDVGYDSYKISWTTNTLNWANRNKTILEKDGQYLSALYRPFFKQFAFFSRDLNERVYQIPKLFPNPSLNNLVICVSGVGATKEFTTIISDTLPDLELIGKSQCFPLYYYEERQNYNPGLFDTPGQSDYIRRDGVSDFILARARDQYGKNVSKEDVFYYVYGFLHSPEYRTTFANDLKKMLPRLPLVEDVRDFWKFSKAGRQLAELHLNYESVPAYEGVEVSGADSGFYRVEKMRFPKKGQQDTIHYNSRITISNIPAKAYEYQVNGKSAIEWIMERYQVTTHKESGIKNDPNDWADEVGNPRYILDLLLSVINVSVQTVDIVKGLPRLVF
jgi:predicted helicase